MGSKKVKALAVRGTRKVPLADEQTFLDLKKKHADQSWGDAGNLMYDFGEDGALDDLNANGRLPRHFNEEHSSTRKPQQEKRCLRPC